MEEIFNLRGFHLFENNGKFEINCCDCIEGSPIDTRQFTLEQLKKIHKAIGDAITDVDIS